MKGVFGPGLTAAFVLAAFAASAQDVSVPASGGQDYDAALARLLDEAQEGSAEAKLGLGTLYDLGLGVARDPAKAFRWYLEAAGEGVADAQFNVAVMLDAGTGVPQDRAEAAIWYARAALRGNVRAQYNLGILFEIGDGVDRNAALARAWLGRAALDLDAARTRLEAIEPAAGGPPAPPRILLGERRLEDGATKAELVWTAPEGAADGRFLVEVVARDASGGFVPISETWTELSAALPEVPGGVPLLWRVTAVGQGDYAASRWRTLGGERSDGEAPAARPEEGGPLGRVRFELPSDDVAALILAAELSASFRLAGLMVVPASLGAASSRARVRYAYPADEALAVRIAAALPGSVEPELDAGDAGDDPVPGTVRVALSGGPAAN